MPVIVGIGSSAGGLEALQEFFSHVNISSNKAYIVIQHLYPNNVSLLKEILQRYTSLSVVEISDGLIVKPCHIYVNPPNRDVLISKGKLQVSIPTHLHAPQLLIDDFFNSPAEDQPNNAIGIIMSGTGSDGTRGLGSILNAGELTLVQEPTTAKYGNMPSSAIETGVATYVLPVNEMP